MGTLGENIRATRHMRQMSPKQLAEILNISESLLFKVESGRRTPAASLVQRIASALKVGTDHLYGQPYYNSTEMEEGAQAVIPELRRVLWTFDSPDDLPSAPRPLPVLIQEMETISRMRQDGHYVKMGPLLPPALTELTHIALAAPAGEVREQAYWWLARGYRAANSLAHKLGHHDLSMTAIERVQWAAAQSGDPYMDVIAGYLRLGALMRQGLWGSADKLIGQLDMQIRGIASGRFNDDSRALLGAVVLKRLAADARQGRPEHVARGLEEAEEIAQASRNADLVAYETAFGPSNIRIHEVHAMLQLGDGTRAVDRARGFTPSANLPGERRSHHHIDLASAQVGAGDRDGALRSLEEARRISPVHTRYHPTARATAATLTRLDQGRHEAVSRFARWVAVAS